MQPGVPEQLSGGGAPGRGPPGPPQRGDEEGPRAGLRLRGGQREARGGPLRHARSVLQLAITCFLLMCRGVKMYT